MKTLIKSFRLKLSKAQALRRLRRFHSRPRTLEETVQWSLDLGTRKDFEVQAVQIFEEILDLTKSVAELRPKIILEIGTARDGTLFI
jgi:hypothetical protein